MNSLVFTVIAALWGLVCGLYPNSRALAAPFEPVNYFADTPPESPAKPVPEPLILPVERDRNYDVFLQYGRSEGRKIWLAGLARDKTPPPTTPIFKEYGDVKRYTARSANRDSGFFIKGRYDRSRARLPENIESWREQPDIANPGADLANWPNSAFTLPEGHAYVEFQPFGYSASSPNGPEQYDMETLFRYGLTDNIELRLFTNGPTHTGGSFNSWNFSPVAFDTKIQCWTEKPDIYVPAMGFEAYIVTEWLGSNPTNGGTQPAFTFNFDQSLPFDIDLEYNIGAGSLRNAAGQTEWQAIFQWALQRDMFDDDFAVFIHGFVNAANLPRNRKMINGQLLSNPPSESVENIIGAGFIWTVNSRVSLWGQSSAGTNQVSPSLLSSAGFAIAF